MSDDNSTGKSSQEPARDRKDVPTPERGSPAPRNEVNAKEAHRKVEKNVEEDANPLAPPVNIQAGS